jgi:hypothetical protein
LKFGGLVKATHVRIDFESKRFAFSVEVERLGYSRLKNRVATVSDYVGTRHLLADRFIPKNHWFEWALSE